MDVRGPYGSLNFDGAPDPAAGDAIGGVAWGRWGAELSAAWGAVLTLNSPWSYNAPHPVNHVQAWTAHVNAEFGIVQTRLSDQSMGYPDRVLGRERGASSASVFFEQGSCAGFGDTRVYTMPCVSGWPYQLMNYDWDPGAGKPLGRTRPEPSCWPGAAPMAGSGPPASKPSTALKASAGAATVPMPPSSWMGPKCRYSVRRSLRSRG